jgi:hypothetical protein
LEYGTENEGGAKLTWFDEGLNRGNSGNPDNKSVKNPQG